MSAVALAGLRAALLSCSVGLQRGVLVGLVGVALLAASDAEAQSSPAPETGRKQATAVRVANGSISVDGRLNDEAWRAATPIADFVQKDPTEGALPTDAMDVRFAD